MGAKPIRVSGCAELPCDDYIVVDVFRHGHQLVVNSVLDECGEPAMVVEAVVGTIGGEVWDEARVGAHDATGAGSGIPTVRVVDGYGRVLRFVTCFDVRDSYGIVAA